VSLPFFNILGQFESDVQLLCKYPFQDIPESGRGKAAIYKQVCIQGAGISFCKSKIKASVKLFLGDRLIVKSGKGKFILSEGINKKKI
jgi:hypothetical protein